MYVDPSGQFILTALIIGVVAGAVIGGTAGGVISYNAAQESGMKGADLFWETMEGIGKGAIVGGVAGGLVGATAGVVVAYGAGSIAGTAMITGTATIAARATEVVGLQYQKSLDDGKSGWQIANDIISSTYNNSGRILSSSGAKALTTFSGYTMHRGFFQAKQLGVDAYLGAYSKSSSYFISYGFVASAWIQTYMSITSVNPVQRAYQRGYSLI